MECINKSFTIQWLGPFDKLDGLKDYFKGENGLDKGLFNFYYFEARKKYVLNLVVISAFTKRTME